MKNKPVAHKNENTFKFLTFSERLNNINIDVVRRIGRISENPEDAGTFFQEAVEKWNDLNYTEHYGALMQEIGSEIKSLSQVLYRKNELFSILLQSLQDSENMALDAILEFIVALARDLQYEFYPFYPKFFVSLSSLLQTKNIELVEKIFTCLTYLFKFLWRYMCKEIEKTYSLFSVLLSDTNKEHLRKFAAESFAFLMRKVEDKPKFFKFIFQELSKNPEKAEGIGYLLFEVVKGVKGQFHSCLAVVLQHLLHGLGFAFSTTSMLNQRNDNFELVENALQTTIECMAKYVTKPHAVEVENVFCEIIFKLLKLSDDETAQKSYVFSHLNHLLHVLAVWLNYKDCCLVSKNSKIFQSMIEIVKVQELPEFCVETIMDVTSCLMLSPNVESPIYFINSLLDFFFHCSPPELVFQFTRTMLPYSLFEKDVLPRLLSYSLKCLNNDESCLQVESLYIVTEVVMSLRPLQRNPEAVKQFSSLQLYIPGSLKKEMPSLNLEQILLNIMENINGKNVINDLSKLWCCFICLPHVRSCKNIINDIEKAANVVCQFLLNENKSYQDSEMFEQVAFVLCDAFLSWLCLCGDLTASNTFNIDFFISLLKVKTDSVSVLRMLYIYLKTVECFDQTEEHVKNILLLLVPNLSTPFHTIRLLSLQVLASFPMELPVSDEGVVEGLSVFNLCLNAEKIPATVNDYREKLKWIRKLEFPSVEKHISIAFKELCQKAPVHYLLGQLFVNFRLLWEPTMNLLNSHAEELKEIFWDVFKPHLYRITDLAETAVAGVGGVKSVNFNNSLQLEKTLFYHNFECLCKHKECSDMINHRNLLWKTMQQFPGVIKQKNPDVIPLLFRFIRNEFIKVDTMLAESEAVLISDSVQPLDIDELSDEEDMDEDPENNEDNPDDDDNQSCSVPLKKRKVSNMSEHEGNHTEAVVTKTATNVIQSRKKSVITPSKREKSQGNAVKTLSAILSLFAKLKKPRTLHRSDDLQQLYRELLTYQEGEIQKLAFDCLMTYNYDYLLPYKDNFINILDDKKFKTEIVLFSLDSESEVIKEKHRIDTLSILMRIVYGKMLRKTGNNTTGRSQAHTRRMLVLRFLAGCRAEELKMFLDLVFAPFKEQLLNGILETVRHIRQNIDLSSVVPIRKLSSALNTLEIVLHVLGSLHPELLPWFLKITLVIGTTSSVLLERRDELLPQCVQLLKKVRIQAVMRIIQFFKSFEHYVFSDDEINAIFEAVIWPSLPKLEKEALNQPPPILRLFDTWSENPIYFPLFAMQNESQGILQPIHYLVSLYASNRVQPRVVGLLSKMFNQMLSLYDKDEKEVNETPVLPLTVIQNLELQRAEESPTYGTTLLLPHIGLVLKRIQIIVSNASKNTKKQLSSRELSILLKISEYVEDSEQCSQLIVLLLSNFNRNKNIGTDAEVLVLSTICNLLKHVQQPRPFVKLFAPLFGTLIGQRSRSALAQVFSVMSENDVGLKKLDCVVLKITAWDTNLMEEPDYLLRFEGHKEALAIVNEMTDTIDEDLIKIIIFNSCYSITKCADLSLRDSASFLLQKIVVKFSYFMEHHSEYFAKFVFEVLLPEIKKSLKSKTEVVRCEFIRILAALLRECGSYPKLSSLAQLCSPDADMDFWENILHLQLHRRARALLRFSASLSSGEIHLPPHFHIDYMLPIVTAFFFDPVYIKHVHVIDASIETLKSIVKCLPWSHYEALLRHYLNLLMKDAEHHKTIIKIVVAVLDSFHFDLSSSRGVPIANKKASKVEEKDNKAIKAEEESLESDIPSLAEHEKAVRKDEQDADKATKIHRAIVNNILPQLRRTLMQKAKTDDEHKLSGSSHPEDEEILRVPIAIAIVKLLQNLPEGNLQRNIPWLFLRMCQFLKSRSESIRETSRNTLVKIMQSLGAQYFSYLLNEMKGIFTRGYLVHVMNFTVNTILQNLKEKMKSGDLDSCINDLTQICSTEMFGDTAEEKDVAKITGRCKEARSCKSFSIYEMLGRFCSEECLISVVKPLKDVLTNAKSHKAVRKIQECLRHIAVGVSENAEITAKGLLIFIHDTITETLSEMAPKQKVCRLANDTKYVRPDIFLIPKEPGRSGPPAKMSVKANAHVMVDFSLQLLHFCLKREKLKGTEKEHLEMLDPFVPILSECLVSNNIKVISITLRCLPWLFKFQLPSLLNAASEVVKSCFVLLSKYAGIGMGQGENFELVIMCFKMLTIVVRDTDYHKLNNDQLHVLLSYIEQDIHDHTRQATAFTLLKAILSKKLESKELVGIMAKISEMAIVSEQDHIRMQCRQVSLHYITKYCLPKNLNDSIGFYVTQLEYSYEHGRVSAIEMINSILEAFTENVIKKHAGVFLVPLAVRLVNDESPNCRKMAVASIKKLLNKVDNDSRTSLCSIALTWLTSEKLSHQRLGAQLCGIFSEVEKDSFVRFLNEFLPAISTILQNTSHFEATTHIEELRTDHFLFHIVNAFGKVLSTCNFVRNRNFESELCSIWERLGQLILHPHAWVRLAVSESFGQLFAHYPVEEVSEIMRNKKKAEKCSIFYCSRQKLRDLSADFATQLQSPCLNEALAEQVIKNLVYLSKVISELPENEEHVPTSKTDKGIEVVDVTLSWIIRKLCREVKQEVSQTPDIIIKRTCVFKYFASICLELDKEKIMPLLANIFMPLCRELADSTLHTDQKIKTLAQEVLEILKNVIGVEYFTNVYAVVQNSLMKKKVQRKQERASEAVTNPERFARKKIKKQLNKKESKKRKILKLKGKRKTKKMKLSHLAIES